MRRDRLLFQAIDQDREYEATESGCCVRRDGSGCVQVPSEADCPVTVSATIYVLHWIFITHSLHDLYMTIKREHVFDQTVFFVIGSFY